MPKNKNISSPIKGDAMNKAYAWMWLQEDFNKELRLPIYKKRHILMNDESSAEADLIARPGAKFRVNDKRLSVYYTDFGFDKRRYLDFPYPKKHSSRQRRVTKGFRAYTNIMDAFSNQEFIGPMLCRIELKNKVNSYNGHEFVSAAELEVLWTYDATKELQSFGIYCAKKLVETINLKLGNKCPPEVITMLIEVIQTAQLSIDGKQNCLLLFDTFGVNFEDLTDKISRLCKNVMDVGELDLILKIANAVREIINITKEPANTARYLYQRFLELSTYSDKSGLSSIKSRFSSIFMNLILPNIPERPATYGIDTWLFLTGDWEEYVGSSGLAKTHPFGIKVHSGLVIIGSGKKWFPKNPIAPIHFLANYDGIPTGVGYHRRCTHINALEAFLDVKNSGFDTVIACKVRMSGNAKFIDNRMYASHMHVLWAVSLKKKEILELGSDWDSKEPEVLDDLDRKIEEHIMKLAPEHEIAKIMEMDWLLPLQQEI